MLVVERCEVNELDDVIIRCGGDNSTSLAWGSLKELDISYNLITKLGDSLVSGAWLWVTYSQNDYAMAYKYNYPCVGSFCEAD